MSVKRDRMSTLITLNVRGFQIGGVSFKKRIGLLFEYLATTEVGELHLQEVYTYGMLRYLRRHLESQFPYVSYSRGAFGPKAGLVSFFRAAPAATAFHRHPVSRVAAVDRLGLIPYIHKGVLVTTLQSGEIRFNLHLDPDHSGEWRSDSPATRLIRTQLDAAADIVLCYGGKDFVVLGDFNLPTETSIYAEFVKRINADDVMQGDGRPTFHKAFLPEGRVPRQIDHVLVAPRGSDVIHELILGEPQGGVYASDHFGIAVTVKSN
jgi:endonuclease/exonuclease/phosphatase family metal-dependent hydrolase